MPPVPEQSRGVGAHELVRKSNILMSPLSYPASKHRSSSVWQSPKPTAQQLRACSATIRQVERGPYPHYCKVSRYPLCTSAHMVFALTQSPSHRIMDRAQRCSNCARQKTACPLSRGVGQCPPPRLKLLRSRRRANAAHMQAPPGRLLPVQRPPLARPAGVYPRSAPRRPPHLLPPRAARPPAQRSLHYAVVMLGRFTT